LHLDEEAVNNMKTKEVLKCLNAWGLKKPKLLPDKKKRLIEHVQEMKEKARMGN